MWARPIPCRVQTTNWLIDDTVPGWWQLGRFRRTLSGTPRPNLFLEGLEQFGHLLFAHLSECGDLWHLIGPWPDAAFPLVDGLIRCIKQEAHFCSGQAESTPQGAESLCAETNGRRITGCFGLLYGGSLAQRGDLLFESCHASL